VSFEPLRPKLLRVAYRMLGSVADAEDIVQEAFFRWMSADRSEVREPVQKYCGEEEADDHRRSREPNAHVARIS